MLPLLESRRDHTGEALPSQDVPLRVGTDGRSSNMKHRMLAALAFVLATRLGAQSSADSTLAQVKTVIASYEPARQIRWYRANDPYESGRLL